MSSSGIENETMLSWILGNPQHDKEFASLHNMVHNKDACIIWRCLSVQRGFYRDFFYNACCQNHSSGRMIMSTACKSCD